MLHGFRQSAAGMAGRLRGRVFALLLWQAAFLLAMWLLLSKLMLFMLGVAVGAALVWRARKKA